MASMRRCSVFSQMAKLSPCPYDQNHPICYAIAALFYSLPLPFAGWRFPFDKFKGFFSVIFSHFIFTRKVVSDRWVFLQKGFPRPRHGLDAMQMRVTVIYSIRIVAENKNRMIHFPTTRAIYMFNMEGEKNVYNRWKKKRPHFVESRPSHLLPSSFIDVNLVFVNSNREWRRLKIKKNINWTCQFHNIRINILSFG